MPTLPPPSHIPRDAATIGQGRYVLLHPLGEGGQCRVVAAWDTHLRMWRAVKILMEKPARRDKHRRRFLQEGEVLQRLKHPNLVRVTELHDEAQPWMVMELVAGGTLFHWVAAHGKMPPRMAVEATLEVAGALAVAHEAGMVHRDVKPRNVLVTSDGRCKLADFGIAQDDTSRMTRTGDVFGTLGFMAPEQFEDTRGVDVRADIYALGATLWFLLTKPSQRDLLRLAGDEELIARVVPQLQPILRRALAPVADDRPASMASFAAQLREVLPHLDIDPRDTPPLATELSIADDAGITLEDVEKVVDQAPSMPGDTPTLLTSDLDEPAYVVYDEPRADPLPPAPAPKPEPKPKASGRSWVLAGGGVAGLGGLAVVLVLTLGCAGGLGWGTYDVRQTAIAHEMAVAELTERLEYEHVVVDDLELLGFDVSGARAAVDTWRDTPTDADRAAAAVVAIREASAPILGPSKPDRPDALLARQRIERLTHALVEESRARAHWEAASQGLFGALATAVGLAPTP